MKSKNFSFFVAKAFTAFLLLAAEDTSAALINLNDFTKDPTVTVAVDGSSAVITEDSALSAVLLSNDPGLGDPNVISPASGLTLVFDYVFVEPATNNQDEFGVFMVDSSTGGSAGSAYEFFTQTAGSGTVNFDLSGLVELTLGLQFQLSALPGDAAFDSNVTISNVRLEQLPVPAIPLPGSGGLLIAGLCGWSLVQSYRAKTKQSGSSSRISSLD